MKVPNFFIENGELQVPWPQNHRTNLRPNRITQHQCQFHHQRESWTPSPKQVFQLQRTQAAGTGRFQ